LHDIILKKLTEKVWHDEKEETRHLFLIVVFFCITKQNKKRE
jgi:hypothetical protein